MHCGQKRPLIKPACIEVPLYVCCLSMVGSWGVCWSRGVVGCGSRSMVGCGGRGVVGSGLMGVGLGFVVTNLSLVLHVCVILCVLINIVVHDLGPAVRQQDLVLTCGSISGQSV